MPAKKKPITKSLKKPDLKDTKKLPPKTHKTGPKKPVLRDSFYASVVPVAIADGEELIALLNEHEAASYGLKPTDQVAISYNGVEHVVNLDLTTDLVWPGQIGLLKEVSTLLKLPKGAAVGVHFTQRDDRSVEAIRKKLKGGILTDEEMYSIIKDISDNKLSKILTTYFVAASIVHEGGVKEMYQTAKAMAETGVMLKRPKGKIIADKHCIGGVPGNETSMIAIPLIASLGITIPKNFSKAITSPAATGECVDVLMDITRSADEIVSLIKKNSGCLIRGGGLDLAPADDKIIRVSYPLSMQSSAKMVASIMAKKYAMGVTHSLIDIPLGPTAKVTTKKAANLLKSQFEQVGKRLGMKMCVEITDAKEPIGAGIGAVLQVREVLRVLQQHTLRPKDLEKKAVFLASRIIENVGLAKGKKALELAWSQLQSGKAWAHMQKFIVAQSHTPRTSFPKTIKTLDDVKYNPTIRSEELPLAPVVYEVFASKSGKITAIDMKQLNMIVRTLGSPLDAQAGLYMTKKRNAKVKKGDLLCTLYTADQNKLKLALDALSHKDIYEIV